MKTERDPYDAKAAEMLAVECEAYDKWGAEFYRKGTYDKTTPVRALSRVLREADKPTEWPKVKNADGVERTLPEWLGWKITRWSERGEQTLEAKAYLDTLQPPEPDPLLLKAREIAGCFNREFDQWPGAKNRVMAILRDVREGRQARLADAERKSSSWESYAERQEKLADRWAETASVRADALSAAQTKIEQLEAALREIAERTSPLNSAGEIARAALNREKSDV